jgi:hypothetical protein
LSVARSVLSLFLVAIPAQFAAAHGSYDALPHYSPALQIQSTNQVPDDLPRLSNFDLHVHPVGQAGLEIPDAVRQLAGQRVRLIGYMAVEADPAPKRFLLTPSPVSIDSLHEAGAGDIPSSTVFVHFPGTADGNEPVPFLPGLISVTGTLDVGHREESDLLPSTFRLMLDEEVVQEFFKAQPMSLNLSK